MPDGSTETNKIRRFDLNASTRELSWSQETCRIVGYDPAIKPSLELFFERIHPEDRTRVKEIINRVSQSGDDLDFECRLLLPHGSVKHVRVLSRAVKSELGRLQYIGAAMDVTAKVRAEEALRASEHSLRLLVDNIPGHVWTGTPAGEVESVNQPVLEYTGKTFEELKDWSTVVHPDDLGPVSSTWNHAVQTGEPLDIEFRLRRADGVYRWFHSRVLPMRDAEGRVVRWYSLATDIDERKNTEEALRASERNLQLMVETIPGYVWYGTPSGEVEFVNKGTLDYSGKTLDEIKNWACVVHPDNVDTLGRTWLHSVETGEPYEIEFRFRRFDGVYRWFVTRGLPLRDSDGLIVRWYGLVYDVDDRKKAEEALHKTQAELAHVTRVMTMGELAASIAHEVNQPLSAIVTNGSACLRWLMGDSPNLEEARETARRIIRDGKQASDL